jgi:hypothetical protein
MRIIVRDNDRGAAVLLQDGEYAVLGSARIDGKAREVAGKRRVVANQDVLEEVELFVAGVRPKMVAMQTLVRRPSDLLCPQSLKSVEERDSNGAFTLSTRNY